MTTLVIILVLLGGAWLLRNYMRGQAPFDKQDSPTLSNERDAYAISKHSTPREFQAVEVRPGSRACQSARNQRQTRYLSTSAPPLPLPGCDVEACHCRYMKYEDRRRADDRRMAYGLLGQYERGLKGERRDVEDRRVG